MATALNILLSIVGSVVALICVAAVIRGTESPKRLAARALFTVALLIGYYFVDKLNLKSIAYIGPVVHVLTYVALLIVLSMVWWAELGDIVGGLAIWGMGGGAVEKSARLSRVEALRKTGRYEEALEAAQEELKRNKNDFDCLMAIASIHAENMDNLALAESLIQSVIDQNKKLERRQITYALNTLADWHLKYGKDPDAARACLEQIIERFPDSRASASAQSRIAHMADRETLEAADKPRPAKVMPKFERNLGLKGKTPQLKKQIDPNELTDQYLAQLEKHPNDWDTRERLAAHYIEHYQNVPCAVQELEFLINSKLASREDKCRWLHQIADWQAKIARNPQAAREALQRIIDKYPGTAQAQRAEQAIPYIRDC